MNGKQAVTIAIHGFSIPAGARAVLVTDAGDGKFTVHPVAHGKSILNVQTEILDHVNSFPHSDAWLQDLRDCCIARLAARAAVKSTGGLAVPLDDGRSWDVAR